MVRCFRYSLSFYVFANMNILYIIYIYIYIYIYITFPSQIGGVRPCCTCGTFAWEPSLRNFRLGYLSWSRSLGKCLLWTFRYMCERDSHFSFNLLSHFCFFLFFATVAVVVGD